MVSAERIVHVLKCISGEDAHKTHLKKYKNLALITGSSVTAISIITYPGDESYGTSKTSIFIYFLYATS